LRLNSLDFTRFTAALSIALYHYIARNDSDSLLVFKEMTKFGYLAVPLFFMISGYSISFSAHKKSAIEFAISRFFRLYPTYWICICITCIISALCGTYNYTLSQLLANLTMLNDYLGFKDIDGIYWTLHVQLKYYGCVFILLLFGIFHKYKLWLSIWIILTVVHLITCKPFFMGWFISPTYSSFFISGVSFYLIHKYGPNVYNLSILIISFVISLLRGFEQVSGFITNPHIVDQLIALLFITFFYILFYSIITGHFCLSTKNYFIILGGLSYPFFLIHNVAGKSIIDNFKEIIPEWFLIICILFLFLVISYLVYYFIDNKISSLMKSKLIELYKIMISSTNKNYT